MKRFLCVVLMVILCCSSVSALAELDEHGIPVVKWEFPVSLSYLQSKYVLLVNENNPLDESFEPDPLVKAKDIKQATNASVYMEEKALDAVKEMFKAASLVTEYSYVDAKGKTRKMCKLDLRGKSDIELTTIIALLLKKNPDIKVGYR